MSDTQASLFELVRSVLDRGEFIALVLAKPVQGQEEHARKQSVRQIVLRGAACCQWELQFERRQTHQNLSFAETADRVRELFGPVYRDAYLYASTADYVVRHRGQGEQIQRRGPSRAAAPATEHNRSKDYLIPEGVPCPFLIALGVMTQNGQVKQAGQKKFRQINRYLEIVNDVYPSLRSDGTLQVIDFGCGLSYLTFAVHHLLTVIHGRDVQMFGIDRNDAVISRCRAITKELGLQGLTFDSLAIREWQGTQAVDLAISLHACDTATDDALAFSVSAGASVILAAPCCQHELFTKLDMGAEFTPLLRQGILKERFAALATDALRAEALGARGYRTQVMEFIELEHTAKNLLIRAVKSPPDEGVREKRAANYALLKQQFGVESLAVDALLASNS